MSCIGGILLYFYKIPELTNKYGFVHTPYFVVPIVGCLFIDFVNSAIITIFINFIR